MKKEYKVGEKTVIAVLSNGKLNCKDCYFNLVTDNLYACGLNKFNYDIPDCVEGRFEDVIYKLKNDK